MGARDIITKFKLFSISVVAGSLLIGPSLYGKTYVVTSVADGPENQVSIETLRGALYDARIKSSDTRDVIKFNLPGGSTTIKLTDGPLVINNTSRRKSIVIDGMSQGKGKNPQVTLDVNGAGAAFQIISGQKHKIRGFVISNFSGNGIFIGQETRKNKILKNWIGFLPKKGGFARNNANSYGKTASGILIHSSRNTVKKNVLSGVHNGLHIGYDPLNKSSFNDRKCSRNVIRSNFIGVNPAGKKAVNNNSDGIFLGPQAKSNFINRNVISGNDSAGVELLHRTVSGNRVTGNKIGTDKSGESVIGNGDNGVHMSNYATGNIIGGTSPRDRNVVSGNKLVGILMEAIPLGRESRQSATNMVIGNYVGCSASGNKSLGRQNLGIYLHGIDSRGSTVRNNVVGGNVISGIYADNTSGHTIELNFVGVNQTGGAIGNGRTGIVVANSSSCRVIRNRVRFNGFAPDGARFAPNGIKVFGSSRITLRGNSVSSNRTQ